MHLVRRELAYLPASIAGADQAAMPSPSTLRDAYAELDTLYQVGSGDACQLRHFSLLQLVRMCIGLDADAYRQHLESFHCHLLTQSATPPDTAALLYTKKACSLKRLVLRHVNS